MWSIRNELDIEKAANDTNELILLASAHKVGIFSAISEERNIDAIIQKTGTDKRALYIVLEALYSMGYVNKNNKNYIISDKARPLFLIHGENYIGGFLLHFLNIMSSWLLLPEIIKGKLPDKELDVAAFMGAMSERPDNIVKEAVKHCLIRKKDAKKVLDLGGGPGKYSKCFVKSGLSSVLYDESQVIDYVGKKFNLLEIEKLVLKKGDFSVDGFEAEFDEVFDIVFMGNICHIYSEETNKKVIKSVWNLLDNNGMIAIEDFVRGRSPKAEMFAVNMLANTESGNTWTEDQYKMWLKDAGFKKIEVFDLVDKGKQLITAFR